VSSTDHDVCIDLPYLRLGIPPAKIQSFSPTCMHVSSWWYLLLPCSSWDSLWNGVAQWLGVTEEDDLNYVLPNRENFGCRLFTDKDLYKNGQNPITGCNGDTLIFDHSVLLNDARYITGEEQKGFCELLKSYVSFATNNSTMRCVVVDQQVSIAPPNGRRLEQAFRVSITSEVSCDWKNFAGPAGRRLNDVDVRADIVYQLDEQSIIANITGITETVITTNSPTSSPSSMPTVSSAPTSPPLKQTLKVSE
jgi:hypothetical protein